MRGMVPHDPASKVSQLRFAIVYVPKRNRNRFPAGNVVVVETKDDALAGASTEQRCFAARVSGPSKSSEGQLLYYLVAWLDEARIPD